MVAKTRRKSNVLPSIELLHQAAKLLEATKGEDIVALDLHDKSSVCDYFLIASGGSEQHVRALGKAVENGLAERGVKVWHREGSEGRRWILLDYVDVVVHVFHPETRDFYRLESLWADAEHVALDIRTSEPDAT